jgi:hypothetical protein
VLVLEHYTGALIQTRYYNDDPLKTIKELREVLIKKQEGNGKEKEEEKGEDISINFWIIYDRLEDNSNGDGRIVNHKKLHEALVSSGKFYTGDATQIISDMVKDGKLEPVSFHSYRKKG